MHCFVAGDLYWTDIESRKINRVHLEDLSDEDVVIESNLDRVDGIHVDVIGRLLYWTGNYDVTMQLYFMFSEVFACVGIAYVVI